MRPTNRLRAQARTLIAPAIVLSGIHFTAQGGVTAVCCVRRALFRQRGTRAPPSTPSTWVSSALAACAVLLSGIAPARDNPHHGREQLAATRAEQRLSPASDPATWVRFKILGLNDFHGQLETQQLGGRPIGGAAVLAAYLASARDAAGGNALIVHAGDQVGASPPNSALLRDEPAIAFLNLLANDACRHDAAATAHRESDSRCNIVGALGNHEFDRGLDEMQRLLRGGRHLAQERGDGDYRGADFPYVSANVVNATDGGTLLTPYVIRSVAGMQVAIIGAVPQSTPSIVTPTGVSAVRFLDEAAAINRYVAEIKRHGVRAIVAAIHQGASQPPHSGPTPAVPVDLGGDIGPIVHALDDEIDIVLAGHWHRFTNALMHNRNGKPILVTQAFSRGTAYADIDVAVDPSSRDIVEKSAEIIMTWADRGPGLRPLPEIEALVSAASARVAPLVERLVGTAAVDISDEENEDGESALGNLVADAQRRAMGTDIALVNPGSIRARIKRGRVDWGDLFTVQPFNNALVRIHLTGTQLIALLNQQWSQQPFPRVLKTSGMTYQWSDAGTLDRFDDDHVLRQTITIGGAPLQRANTYSVAVNSFLASGGDKFSVLPEGHRDGAGPRELEALVTYIRNLNEPLAPGIERRILRAR